MKNWLVERHEAVRKVLCSENQGQGFRKKPELWDGREMSIGKNSWKAFGFSKRGLSYLFVAPVSEDTFKQEGQLTEDSHIL